MKQKELEQLVNEVLEAHNAGFIYETDTGFGRTEHQIMIARTKKPLFRCKKVAEHIEEKYKVRVDVHGSGQGYGAVFCIYIDKKLDLKEAMSILPYDCYRRSFY